MPVCPVECVSLSNRVSTIITGYTDHMKFAASFVFFWFCFVSLYIQVDTKKRELLKNPTKIEEIQEKKFIGRN